MADSKGDFQAAWDVIHADCWDGGQHGIAKPLSMDLRERVVGAVLNDGMSARGAAARFGVVAVVRGDGLDACLR